MIKRREFIGGLGSTAVWPLAARAQQGERVRRIGVMISVANNALGQARFKAFQQGLERLGWTDGRNLAIEVRWSEGRAERYAEITAEFVRLKVDVIVTTATLPTILAKEATQVIPIVFIGAADPVATGLVGSLAHPSGNVTGLSNQSRDIASKRVEMLRQLVPGLRRVAILGNTDNAANVLEMREVQAAANTLGLDVVRLEIRRAEEIASALEPLKGPALALYVVIDAVTNANALRINTFALAARLPTMHGTRESVEAGGLLSYGADFLEVYRHSASLVDKILRGTKPGEIPVEQPTRFNLVINLTTAKALGLTIPETLLATADEVIQ
jgi:putative tryptophan/tyrosine transport system substrate-binding protein